MDFDLRQVSLFIGHLLKNKLELALWTRLESVTQVEETVRGEKERCGLAWRVQGAPK